MARLITSSYAISKAKGFFNDKKAITQVKLSNLNGDEIDKNSLVTINGRGDTKISFNIESEKGVIIRNIWCEYLELQEDGDQD